MTKSHTKFFLVLAGAIAIASTSMTPAWARFSSSTYHSSSNSYHSNSSSSSTSRYSSPRYSSSNYKSSPVTTTKYTSSGYVSSGSITASRPIQTAPNYANRSTYNAPTTTYVHHDSGILGNPFFWMWAMDRHQQPVYVNGAQPAVQQGATADYSSPNPIGAFFGWLIQLAILVGIGWAIWYFFFRKKF